MKTYLYRALIFLKLDVKMAIHLKTNIFPTLLYRSSSSFKLKLKVF